VVDSCDTENLITSKNVLSELQMSSQIEFYGSVFDVMYVDLL